MRGEKLEKQLGLLLGHFWVNGGEVSFSQREPGATDSVSKRAAQPEAHFAASTVAAERTMGLG